MENKKQNIILSLSLAIAFILALGLSYAYFSAKFYGVENASTISLKGGKMTIDYEEGANITLSGIYPKEEAWASKTFTLTGNNNTTDNMKYKIGLIIEQNTFSEEAITYSLEKTLNEGGTVVDDVDESPIIKTSGTQYIGYGYFGTSTNTHHTYNLKIYFKPNGIDQNEDQKAKFKVKITVEECLDEDLITVTFNADGGTLANNTKTVLANGVYGTLPTPTKEGYEFLGWNGKNMFTGLILGKGLNHNTGAEVNKNKSGLSNFIEIDFNNSSSYYISGMSNEINGYVALYNENKEFKARTSGSVRSSLILNQNTTFSVQTEATGDIKYIRIVQFQTAENTETTEIDKLLIQLEEGTEATAYEPYYITKDLNIVQNHNHTLKAIWQEVS